MNINQNPIISKNLTYLLEIETLAQDILTLKETKLELSNTLNKLQESFRALQKIEEKRTFLKVGSLFFENSTEVCKSIIQKEIDTIKQQYNLTCSEIKEKLSKKRDLEHEPEIKGIGLKPLSYSEASGIMKAFGMK